MLRTIGAILAAGACYIQSVQAQTNVAGPLFANTNWSLAGSPYHITGDVLVVNGATLTIQSGVEVLFDEGTSLVVDGALHAEGTLTDSIRFDAWDATAVGGSWKSIRFTSLALPYDSLTNTGCLLRYCIVENGGRNEGFTSRPALNLDQSTGIWIEHCSMRRCTLVAFLNGPLNVFRHCRVHQLEGSSPGATFISTNTFGPGSLANANRVEHCVLEGLNPGAFIDGPTRFLHNCVTLNAAGFNTYGPHLPALSVYAVQHVIIQGNGFHDNCGSAITFFNSNDATVQVLDNEFSNNLIDLAFVNCTTAPLIQHNDFLDHGNYIAGIWPDLPVWSVCSPIVGSYFDLDLSQNYFGGLDSAALSGHMFDLYDDINSQGIIHYTPLIAQPYGNALADCASNGFECYDSTFMAIALPLRDEQPLLWITGSASGALVHYGRMGLDAWLSAHDGLGREIWHKQLAGVDGQIALPKEMGMHGIILLVATARNGKAVAKWVRVE